MRIMKKYLFFAAAFVALASCSNDSFVGDNSPTMGGESGNGGAIVFSSGTNGITRANHEGADAATLLNNNFVFAGTKGTSPTTFVFDQYNMNYVENTAHTTESNSSNWEYVSYDPASTTTLPSGAKQTIKYWDYSTTQYDFAAYSLGAGYDDDADPATVPQYATPSAIAKGNKSYTLQGSKDALAACYISNLVTAYNHDGVNDYGNIVNFTFRSLGSKIRVALYETIPGYSVKDVKFYTAASGALATDGTESDVTLFAESKVLPTGNGTMTVTFPTVGWDNRTATDYNKAHVSFAATDADADLSTTLVLEDLANFAAKEGVQADGYYLGRTSNTATFAGGLVGSPAAGKYFTILPYEAGTNLTLRIKYTLVSTDGSGEEVTVDNATAVIPAEYTKWNPNYAYTYIFKISDYTNGSTGVDGNGNIVTGLTPITFDAVVIDSEDGLQETITTVSSPSITTYAKGEVVTANDEYLVSNNIYAIVNKDGSNQTLTVGTNAWLYTATLASGAAQTLSEASIDNALANGKYNRSENTWTVTDAKSENLVVTLNNGLSAITEIPAADSPSGNTLTITGAKFTPAAAGTYVLRYQVTAPIYNAGTLGSALTAAGVTTLDGYFTKDAEVYTQCNSTTAPTAETTYYKITTPGKYMYKIVKVGAP